MFFVVLNTTTYIDSLINAIDEDIRYEELLRNKRLKNNKDNYNCNDNNNIKL